MVLRDAPPAIRDEGVDALIVDQIEQAGGTVAEHLGLPFVNVAAALPVNLDVSVPPVTFPWSHRTGIWARLRNRMGNSASELSFAGLGVCPRIRSCPGIAPEFPRGFGLSAAAPPSARTIPRNLP
jgi:zeaxanthin glucosyltransferase